METSRKVSASSYFELPGRMLSLTTIGVKATLMLAIEIAG
jgi:hypothetical protein